jgi:hypothetical protein
MYTCYRPAVLWQWNSTKIWMPSSLVYKLRASNIKRNRHCLEFLLSLPADAGWSSFGVWSAHRNGITRISGFEFYCCIIRKKLN